MGGRYFRRRYRLCSPSATFEKTIGFIGGEAGEKKKNPAVKKMRLVVRGSNVITAFPF